MTNLAEFEFVSYSNFTETFRFFHEYLEDEVTSAHAKEEIRQGRLRISEDEHRHVSSVLAHFANTSNMSSPSGQDLSYIYDNYVQDSTYSEYGEIMEIAAAQTLFLNGFFRDQMRNRHNVYWYDGLGQFFYARAGRFGSGHNHNQVMRQMAENFTFWAHRCRRLNLTLRDNAYIIWH